VNVQVSSPERNRGNLFGKGKFAVNYTDFSSPANQNCREKDTHVSGQLEYACGIGDQRRMKLSG
jgi:hypothetical protein